MKRFVDITFSSFLLALFLPVILIISILLRIKIGSPVLFKQLRPGLNGKPFEIYKFRTMTFEKHNNGEILPDKDRLTDFGILLRRFSLDELPQLFNVLKGDLSLVGPRPLLMEYLPIYNDQQARRHEVKPGITGWAQVNGRNALSWEDRFKLDIWYVDNRSFFLDMKIIGLTMINVLRGEGISQEGHVTMDKFRGTSL